MTKKQHIGSHNNHARSDEKMSPAKHYMSGLKGKENQYPTSAQNKVNQKVANGKRRQRDKGDV